jgi:hypothetical protein
LPKGGYATLLVNGFYTLTVQTDLEEVAILGCDLAIELKSWIGLSIQKKLPLLVTRVIGCNARSGFPRWNVGQIVAAFSTHETSDGSDAAERRFGDHVRCGDSASRIS